MTHSHEESLEALAGLLGIAPEYYDNWGNRHETSKETRDAIIAALGIKDPAAYLRELQLRPWNMFIEPVLAVFADEQPQGIPIHFPLDEEEETGVVIKWRVQDESGRRDSREFKGVRPVDSTTIGDRRYVRVELPNETDRELGYYTIGVSCTTARGMHRGRMRLVIAPRKCHVPDTRTWGISLNLYSIRSGGNWGFGDLRDLRDLARWVRQDLGGGFIGINPLHAIPNRMPYGVSPYASTSRLYRNFMYIDAEEALRGTKAGEKLLGELSGEIASAREKELIDYEMIADIKMKALLKAFAAFGRKHMKKDTAEGRDFRRYIKGEGEALDNFAAFMALKTHLRAKDPSLYRWQDWPEKYRCPLDKAVQRFKKRHSSQVMFQKYLQWLIEMQLKEAADAAGDMDIGIYQDLAVGSSGEGADAWSYPGIFAFGAMAGAPPDAFNTNGQNWGFPPFIPHRLRESGYELFIQTTRKCIEHSGAIRIDHALGLFRLFYIPRGMSPVEGTYVRYPHEDLLKIIALESVRNRAAIIAEDLGTIGQEVREALMAFGMLSYRLLYFERDLHDRAFFPPHAYPEMAFTAVTTHDLPTLWGYWSDHDIEVKQALGLYHNGDEIARDRHERDDDKRRLIDALRGLLPQGWDKNERWHSMDGGLCLAIHRFLARTPCKLVSVSLDDILETQQQQNMPGTLDTHPNWRQKTPLDLDGIFGHPNAKALAAMFREENRGRPEGQAVNTALDQGTSTTSQTIK